MSGLPSQPLPWYVKGLICLLVLPVFGFPVLLSDLPADNTARILTWFYPAYVIGAAVCAWMCYGRRPELTWILLVLMLMTHAAMWALVFG